MLWKGSNGPATRLTCIIHNCKAYWSTLGPFRYPRGGPKGSIWPKTGDTWPKLTTDPMMLWKGPNGPETLLICKIHNHIAYWPTLGPFRYPRGGPKG